MKDFKFLSMQLLAKWILLFTIAVLTGCNKNEDLKDKSLETVSLSFVHEAISNAPEKNFEKENLPVWLTDFIHNLKPDNGRDVAAFQTQWKGEVIYYVYDDFFSCLLCTTFKSNGEKFDASTNNFFEFWASEQDWEMVYLSKSKIHDL